MSRRCFRVYLLVLLLLIIFLQDMNLLEAQECSPSRLITQMPDSLSGLSGDGRYIVFTSERSDLVLNDTNGRPDVFVYDRITCETTLVSVSSNGVQGNDLSHVPSITPDGRYIVFVSYATNLVANDTNNRPDIFIRDRKTGQTTLESISSDGKQGNRDSWGGKISNDGRYIAFISDAILSQGETNSGWNVYVRDRQTKQTICASASYDGTTSNGFGFADATISRNGRYAAYYSFAYNLVLNDTNNTNDVFVHDIQTRKTKRVSVSSGGVQGNGQSLYPAFYGDGRYVLFISEATNLVPGDTNGVRDLFMHDQVTGKTTRINLGSGGTQLNHGIDNFDVTPDGRWIAFSSWASNVVADDTNDAPDVFVHDRWTAKTIRVSLYPDGSQIIWASSDLLALSDDGRYVGFTSSAAIFPDDNNQAWDGFIVSTVPPDPLTIAPKRNYFIGSMPRTLTWGYIEWAADYQVQIANNSLFTSPLAHDRKTSGATEIALPEFDRGTYFWRVRAIRANNTPGAWSAVESFTVGMP